MTYGVRNLTPKELSNLKFYKCHKKIHALPMTRGDYNLYRGWTIPANEAPAEAGYLTIYSKDVLGLHYESWSPAPQFEAGYSESLTTLTFGEALQALEQGNKVARAGWNGKGMYLFMRVECVSSDNSELEALTGIKNVVLPPIACMKTADDKVVEGWLASQTDMFSKDWEIVT